MRLMRIRHPHVITLMQLPAREFNKPDVECTIDYYTELKTGDAGISDENKIADIR